MNALSIPEDSRLPDGCGWGAVVTAPGGTGYYVLHAATGRWCIVRITPEGWEPGDDPAERAREVLEASQWYSGGGGFGTVTMPCPL